MAAGHDYDNFIRALRDALGGGYTVEATGYTQNGWYARVTHEGAFKFINAIPHPDDPPLCAIDAADQIKAVLNG